MCLERLSKFKVKGKIGWKAFENIGGHLYGKSIYTPRLKIGRWMNEKKYRDPSNLGQRFIFTNYNAIYPMGWHVWLRSHLDDEDALRPVKFRKVVGTGFQRGRGIIVAKEIYIIPFRKIKEYMKER